MTKHFINHRDGDSAICSSFLCSFQLFPPPCSKGTATKVNPYAFLCFFHSLPDFSTSILLILALLLLFAILHYLGRPLSLVSFLLLSALTPSYSYLPLSYLSALWAAFMLLA